MKINLAEIKIAGKADGILLNGKLEMTSCLLEVIRIIQLNSLLKVLLILRSHSVNYNNILFNTKILNI
jgi:hypothetical protein